MMEMFYAEFQQLKYKVVRRQWDGEMPVISKEEADIVLLEFPALDETVIRPGLIPRLNFCILVCRANRIWAKIDKELLRLFMKNTGNSPSFVLNGVSVDFAEEVIGEVPKKRKLVRTTIKRLAKFEFGNRRTLSRKKSNMN